MIQPIIRRESLKRTLFLLIYERNSIPMIIMEESELSESDYTDDELRMFFAFHPELRELFLRPREPTEGEK